MPWCALSYAFGVLARTWRGESLSPALGRQKRAHRLGTFLGMFLVTSLGTLMGECRKERGLAASFCARGGAACQHSRSRYARRAVAQAGQLSGSPGPAWNFVGNLTFGG